VSRRGRAGAALTLATLSAACAKQTSPAGEGASSSPAPTAAATEPTPVDHLAPGELVEGTEYAFGLALPRELHVEGAFVDVVYARGPAAVHPVVRYLRQRLEQGDIREEEATATFDHVRVRGKPGPMFAIRILASEAGGVRVEMRDVTPQPAPNLPDDSARWRHVGLTVNGKLADPAHLD
jgi:hypothetical protein